MNLEKLKSRKLWVLVATAAFTVLGKEVLGLDSDTITKLVAIASSYVLGQGIADMNKA